MRLQKKKLVTYWQDWIMLILETQKSNLRIGFLLLQLGLSFFKEMLS